jgi:hypothetical protein
MHYHYLVWAPSTILIDNIRYIKIKNWYYKK